MSEPRTERTPALLHEADGHLRQARAHLAAVPPAYADALAEVLATVRTSLRAYLAWNGSADVPEDTDLHALAARTVHLASILKTPAHRAVLLAERAPAIEQALRPSGRPSLADRDDVETGWYTARNLYQTVLGEVPASHRPAAQRPTPVRSEPVKAPA